MTETYLLRDAYGNLLLKINNLAPYYANLLREKRKEMAWLTKPHKRCKCKRMTYRSKYLRF